MSPHATTATGGSAESQADSLDERSWRPRRGIGTLLRIAMVVVPAGLSFLAVWATMEVVPAPHALLPRLAWLGLLLAVAGAAMRTVRLLTRELAPLGTLFQMSLVFPDAAPSRFRTALRARTGRQLERGETGAAPTDQEAAENLVVLLARIGSHDRLTRGHSERVRAYSVMLGEEIDLPADDLAKLNWAALAHDVGKLDVPAEILNKNGRPTDEEWQVLRSHPQAAAKFTESLRPWLGDWIDCATQHHERFDGGGYPAGLAGNEISLSGRIVSIADAFDVMTAARSYKRPLPVEQARAELLRNAGTQFDPRLVRSFLHISLPRPNRVAGWIGWMSSLPNFVAVPVVPAAQTAGNLVAAATISAAAILGAPVTQAAGDAVDFAVGRSVVEDDAGTGTRTTSGPAPTPDDPTTTTRATATPTTTTTGTPTPENPASTDSTSTTTPGVPGLPAVTTTLTETPTTTMPAVTTTTLTTTTTTIAISTTTTSSTTTTTVPTTTAVDDVATVVNIVGGTVAVLANDDFSGSSADTATLAVVSPPGRGTATVLGSLIRYTPDLFETGGTDTFTYRICSQAGSCDTATVVVALAI